MNRISEKNNIYWVLIFLAYIILYYFKLINMSDILTISFSLSCVIFTIASMLNRDSFIFYIFSCLGFFCIAVFPFINLNKAYISFFDTNMILLLSMFLIFLTFILQDIKRTKHMKNISYLQKDLNELFRLHKEQEEYYNSFKRYKETDKKFNRQKDEIIEILLEKTQKIADENINDLRNMFNEIVENRDYADNQDLLKLNELRDVYDNYEETLTSFNEHKNKYYETVKSLTND